MQTCDVCKLRHQKCSGGRPSCSHCQLRNLYCVYSTIPAHKVNRSVVRRRDSVLDAQNAAEANNNNKNSALPPVQARDPVPPSNPEIRPKPSSRDERPRILARPSSTQALAPRSAVTASLQYFVRAVTTILLGEDDNERPTRSDNSTEHDQLKATHVWKPVEPRKFELLEREHLPPKSYSQSLLNSFLEGPNKLIYICDPLMSQAQLNQLYDKNITVENELVALIFLQLAVGAQVTDQVTEEICDVWYESGRAKMDKAMENDQDSWLWVLQANLLICLHFMVSKPSNCYITLGMFSCVSSHCLARCLPRACRFCHSSGSDISVGSPV